MSGERDLGRLLAGLDPVLADEPYVFAVAPDRLVPADLRPFATVDEDEGLTVVAGFFHDHLLVPWDRADEAIALLRSLGRKRD